MYIHTIDLYLQQLNGENTGKMATANFIIKGKTHTVYVRFKHRDIDLTTSLQIYINPAHWDQKNQRIKNTLQVPNRDQINEILAMLKIHIISTFNQDYTSGQLIDKNWLNIVISRFYERPEAESAHTVFLLDFANWWIREKAPSYKTSSGDYMTEKTLGTYKQAADNIANFEKFQKTKIKLTQADAETFDAFSIYLSDVENYAEATVKRRIKRIKFFFARAEELNIEVNKQYKMPVYVRKNKESYKEPYLNEAEIEKVFNYETENTTLQIVRDNWIIGLWTGLRISDFLTRLETENIQGDFIEIKTLKTGANVAIPLHWQVKAILNKYNGQLPPKISEQKFNRYIKLISKDLNFNQKLIGGISKIDPDTGLKRKIIGTYEKWELITSHICRRSFATNLFGKVPNSVIMAVAGWSNESQMLAYIKKTNLESAIALKNYWEKL